MAPRSKKIMVVDDDPFTRDRVAAILAEAGYVVEELASPSDGYDRCAKAPGDYGLVFMDVRFPQGAVGYSVAQGIAQFTGQGGPNVIGITGYRDLYDYENRREFGMVDVILKPLHANLLVQLARKHFRCPA